MKCNPYPSAIINVLNNLELITKDYLWLKTEESKPNEAKKALWKQVKTKRTRKSTKCGLEKGILPFLEPFRHCFIGIPDYVVTELECFISTKAMSGTIE